MIPAAGLTLLISSRNYSSWCLRGWLMAKLSGLAFEVQSVSLDDPSVRAELLLRSSSILVPNLMHGAVAVWDTLAIGEYFNELAPAAGMLPADRAARARCRSICGEMHSGFDALRSSLPMNLRGHHPGFAVWSGVQADIERIRGDLARVPGGGRAVSVRRSADDGGCDVCAGSDAVCDV